MYIDHISFLLVTDKIIKVHPTIKCRADSVNDLGIRLYLTEGVIETDLYVKPIGNH